MTNSENIDQNNQDSTAIRAAELAVIGEVVSVVGDVISTFAAVLQLEEVRQSEIDNKNMQKQIDDLTNEVKKLKEQVYKENPRRS
jgi:rRNA processing protein Gar1